MCRLSKEKLVAVAASLERSQRKLTAVIYARRAANPEIGRRSVAHILRKFGLTKMVKTGSSFGS